MKFVSKLFAAFFAMIVLPALAQFHTNVATGGADTKMVIRPDGAGKATLTLTGVKVVYQYDPKVEGVKSRPDVSGKGPVWIVDPKAAPNVAGAEVCLSGVGSGGWPIVDGVVDKTKVSCAPLATEMTFSASIENDGGNSCVGFTWLVVKDGKLVSKTWASHPGGITKVMAKRASGETDMTTVLCIDQGGNVTAPADNQIEPYKAYYTKATAAS